jgi:hypothetical protein
VIIVKVKTGIAYMLAGAGALYAYQKYMDGSMKRTVNKIKREAQNKLENMKNNPVQ